MKTKLYRPALGSQQMLAKHPSWAFSISILYTCSGIQIPSFKFSSQWSRRNGTVIQNNPQGMGRLWCLLRWGGGGHEDKGLAMVLLCCSSTQLHIIYLVHRELAMVLAICWVSRYSLWLNLERTPKKDFSNWTVGIMETWVLLHLYYLL